MYRDATSTTSSSSGAPPASFAKKDERPGHTYNTIGVHLEMSNKRQKPDALGYIPTKRGKGSINDHRISNLHVLDQHHVGDKDEAKEEYQ
mmetsp:Transcript_33090/g.66747  ORF Transcript_33090/g.66747 Transcript_33090/m.66747 type:complete len:90 (+) Transcript_33090:2534-2803(+)